jgi:hypothetical protein
MKQLQLLPAAPPTKKLARKTPAPVCIYCGLPGDTRDHVPPRLLLEKPFPPDLRIVPACRTCNEGWSLDEEYFAVILAHVGQHPLLEAKIENEGKIDRALADSEGLDQAIINSLQITEDGRVQILPDMDRIGRIATKIAFGLYCLEYGHTRSLRDFSINWISTPDQDIPQHIVAAHSVWPGNRLKRRIAVQPGIFSFLFAKGSTSGEPPLYCFLEFYSTILIAVSCPAPVGARTDNRLHSKPWSQQG